MPERRQLAVFVRDLACGQSLNEPSIVGHKNVLIAAGQEQQRNGLKWNRRRQRSGIPLPALGCFRCAETLLRSGCHVHLWVLSRNAERRAERADRSKELRVFQAEHHGAPGPHRNTGDGPAVAGCNRPGPSVHVIDQVLDDEILGTSHSDRRRCSHTNCRRPTASLRSCRARPAHETSRASRTPCGPDRRHAAST